MILCKTLCVIPCVLIIIGRAYAFCFDFSHGESEFVDVVPQGEGTCGGCIYSEQEGEGTAYNVCDSPNLEVGVVCHGWVELPGVGCTGDPSYSVDTGCCRHELHDGHCSPEHRAGCTPLQRGPVEGSSRWEKFRCVGSHENDT